MMLSIRLLVLLMTTLALAGCANAPGDPPRSRPNVVIVLADDMGYGDPGCFHASSRIKTPNINRLAREGMRFVDAHSPGAWCVPSRYGLLTGQYPFRQQGELTCQSL